MNRQDKVELFELISKINEKHYEKDNSNIGEINLIYKKLVQLLELIRDVHHSITEIKIQLVIDNKDVEWRLKRNKRNHWLLLTPQEAFGTFIKHDEDQRNDIARYMYQHEVSFKDLYDGIYKDLNLQFSK